MELKHIEILKPIREKYTVFESHQIWLITQTELMQVIEIRRELGMRTQFDMSCGQCKPQILKEIIQLYDNI
jgi:hypothetical protein